MILPTEADIGRAVLFRNVGQNRVETGVITSFNHLYVFVRYGAGDTSAATTHEDLEWAPPPRELDREEPMEKVIEALQAEMERLRRERDQARKSGDIARADRFGDRVGGFQAAIDIIRRDFAANG